jgi:hypothetical protein
VAAERASVLAVIGGVVVIVVAWLVIAVRRERRARFSVIAREVAVSRARPDPLPRSAAAAPASSPTGQQRHLVLGSSVAPKAGGPSTHSRTARAS